MLVTEVPYMIAILQWALPPLTAVYLVWSIFLAEKPWQENLLTFMLLLYVFGKYIQIAGIGPGYLRWYLADVGFMGTPGGVLLMIGSLVDDYRIHSVLRARDWTYIAFLGACVLEVVYMYYHEKLVEADALVRGDIIDLTIFFVTGVIAIALVGELEDMARDEHKN